MASVKEMLHDGLEYGYGIPQDIPMDFALFKKKRDAAILRLNGAYETNWAREGIEMIRGTASFTSPHEISVDMEDGSGKTSYTAPYILIATGGYPVVPDDVEGAECAITSDGFFDIEHLPKKMAVVGAGYIAVELAGVLNALGVEVHMFIRGDYFLRKFDPMIQATLTKRYEDVGIVVHKGFEGFTKVERIDGGTPGSESITQGLGRTKKCQGPCEGKKLKATEKGGKVWEFDELLWAVGRAPETKDLQLEKAGVELSKGGFVKVDDFQNTTTSGVYALGDVTGQLELTPGKSAQDLQILGAAARKEF
jgi:glutathione reductase (NADPH)